VRLLPSVLAAHCGLASLLPAQTPRDLTAASLDPIIAAAPADGSVDVRTRTSAPGTPGDTLSPRGIGAARRWIHAEFERISGTAADAGGAGRPESPPGFRPTNVVSAAIQRGTEDPGRFLLSGDIDSRVSDIMNATDPSPGANDNASRSPPPVGTAAPPHLRGPIVYAALAGENGLLGGRTVAAMAQARGWR
jgi:hypothetical protein